MSLIVVIRINKTENLYICDQLFISQLNKHKMAFEFLKKVIEDKIGDAAEALEGLKDKAEGLVGSDMMQQATAKFDELKDMATDKLADAQEMAGGLKDAAMDKFNDIKEDVTAGNFSEIKDNLMHKAGELKDMAADKLADAKDAIMGKDDTAA